jgi:hypothetical protein
MAEKKFFHSIDLQDVGALNNARIRRISKASLTQIESDLALLTLSERQARDGLSFIVTDEAAGAGDGVGDSFGRSIYSYNSEAGRFQSGFHYSNATGNAVLAPNQDLAALNLRAGEFFVYDGTAGPATFTSGARAVVVFGDQNLKGPDPVTFSPNEMIYVAISDNDQLLLIVIPIVRETQGSKSYFAETNLAIGVNTITHNLGLTNVNGFVAQVQDGNGSVSSVDIDAVDANSLTVTTLLPIANAKITVLGF